VSVKSKTFFHLKVGAYIMDVTATVLIVRTNVLKRPSTYGLRYLLAYKFDLHELIDQTPKKILNRNVKKLFELAHSYVFSCQYIFLLNFTPVLKNHIWQLSSLEVPLVGS